MYVTLISNTEKCNRKQVYKLYSKAPFPVTDIFFKDLKSCTMKFKK
jgi:hypothetical protein